MLRGCIAIGELKCDMCKSNIEHGKRYLLIAEDNEAEDKNQRICTDCCLSKKYASLIKEKGTEVLTFFAD